jgi:hypothetical protein
VIITIISSFTNITEKIYLLEKINMIGDKFIGGNTIFCGCVGYVGVMVMLDIHKSIV